MANAVDHLFDRDGNVANLLRALSDIELAEQMEWYQVQADHAVKADRVHFHRLLSEAYAIEDERHENESPSAT